MLGLLQILDKQGEWIRDRFTPKNQIRLGVIMTDIGLTLVPIGFLVPEPPLIYQMSAGALLFAGIGTVVTAVLAQEEKEYRENEET